MLAEKLGNSFVESDYSKLWVVHIKMCILAKKKDAYNLLPRLPGSSHFVIYRMNVERDMENFNSIM
jgi:hypothetical protein